ncbi:hypothetical protein [Legionella bononiensis]|uniref:Uncharacterized protein n=1 Tax=Legionella bononiensis TaxID=2793102 RepID=A0ABS1WEG0_9GAMM|nr:hypothetical protein [Legionella bononiensis]MBL7527752.1 hypothetical protein [Legionella bononiensis]
MALQVLACLPEAERATAVMTKNRQGQTVLHRAELYTESLKLLQTCVREEKSTAASSSPSFFSHDHSLKPSSSEQVTLDTETSPKRPRH